MSDLHFGKRFLKEEVIPKRLGRKRGIGSLAVNYLARVLKLKRIFVQIAECISPNSKMYLSKLLNVFGQN